MMRLRVAPRLLRVAAVMVRYRLDETIDAKRIVRPLKILRAFLPQARADVRGLPRGERLRLALNDLGPIFVKAGQVMSTRRDLVPADIATELAMLQDQVPPFPGETARELIEQALGAPIDTLYAQFETKPLASASIAQVHAARLKDQREAVIKVLRPGIEKRVARDIELLHELGYLAKRWHPQADKIRPMDVVAEIEKTLHNELDLQHEGANASLLRRNFENSSDLYVPEVFWELSKQRVLTMERVRGVRVDDIAALDAAGMDRPKLAAKGVQLFYEQVFRDNFFHADAHPGNIWVDVSRPADLRFIALDFGIMGSLPEADQYWLAENFIAMFERDYRRIAELHVAAGWMPDSVRVDELEAAVRTVCEPYFSRPLSQISVAELAAKLFQTARRFELTLQPQLILLQKTLLNIEGVGRLLDPDIDIWAVAHPVLKRILRERYHPRHVANEIRRRLPEWLRAAPQMPGLAYEFLQNTVAGQTQVHFSSTDLQRLHSESQRVSKLVAGGMLGGSLLVVATLLWSLAHLSWWVIGAVAAVGLLSFVVSWPRSR